MRLALFVLAVFAVLFLAGCTTSTQFKTEQPAQGEHMMDDGQMMEGATHDEEMMEEMMQQPEVQEVAITASTWRFEPSTVRVRQGTKVRLMIKSIDVDHGFALRAYDIDVKLRPGETETVEFVAGKAGTFEFFCSVYCGSGHPNMRGTLIVE